LLDAESWTDIYDKISIRVSQAKVIYKRLSTFNKKLMKYLEDGLRFS